ncbi:uncharacterized protein BCR38DRAFT_479987 [Pseudomassariella vexata]|uniref:Uncharacterized protein n=1 Tax=Pseudomassariella vexata TaxID=1141098 RepID=A0A1Y2EJP9_9PEZI|nr:uncharacterized protein BCR38DRAFT_479987 [Pseudomassariella vexata]ORY71496.1 hypothetical protein BCR38DRAFT_479987 [Pseudomassariella vexata]
MDDWCEVLVSASSIPKAFDAKHASPSGMNFAYSAAERIEKFNEDPESYDKYCHDVERGLRQRANLMQLNSNGRKNSREVTSELMKEKLCSDSRLTTQSTWLFAPLFDATIVPLFKVTGRDGVDMHYQFGDFLVGTLVENFATHQ